MWEHAEARAIERISSAEQAQVSRESRELAMLAGLLVSNSPSQEVVERVVSRFMEPAVGEDQEGESQSLKMLFGIHAEPGLRDKLAKSVARQIEGMEARRRAKWIMIMGARQDSDESSALVREAARCHMGASYAWQERGRLEEAAARGGRARKPAL